MSKVKFDMIRLRLADQGDALPRDVITRAAWPNLSVYIREGHDQSTADFREGMTRSKDETEGDDHCR